MNLLIQLLPILYLLPLLLLPANSITELLLKDHSSLLLISFNNYVTIGYKHKYWIHSAREI